MSPNDTEPTPDKQSLLSVIGSVLASMFGVQSGSKHKEDFVHGKATTYIIIGLVATVVFIFAIWGLVQIVVGITAKG